MRIAVFSFFLILVILTSSAPINSSTSVLKQRVEKNVKLKMQEIISGLTFDELVELSKTSKPNLQLKAKLDEHLSTIYIVNRNNGHKLDKPYIRIADFNIYRGYTISQIKEILLNPKSYEKKYIQNVKRRNRKNFKDELYTLTETDILCINEADIGLPRTEYKNTVAELSDALNWNYAYATEYIELGAIVQMHNIDRDLYKGLHGNVILSKFPIISAEVIRLPEQYDWYRNEIKPKQPPLEHIRKFAALSIFSERILPREVRHGTRNALITDIQLPNDQIVTVVLTHLEDRAYSDERLEQFQYLLRHVKDKKTPVILTGDFNTSTTDTKPTSVKKEIHKRVRDPHFIARAVAVPFLPGISAVSGAVAVPCSKLLQYKDPFFLSIPVVFPNHERKFYATLKDFRFSDGNVFDLSGDKTKSSNGRGGLLANSNQRHWKGFKSTFKLEKPRIIAYFKLDWFFVKPVGNHFVPFNGKTLKTLNYSFKGHLSDHNPITVDLKL
ncbi:MAG: endonuclease/exonuclease/phosphatase family protein [Candidatus Melainabacteria bacterium]|nr:endonuclease/exonuclease/phosphatase family protein [Candidatus Melainabacteria bacterium]